jgi:hypothetical protein
MDLKETGGVCVLDSSGSEWEPVSGCFCEHSNESLRTTKGRNVLSSRDIIFSRNTQIHD